MVWGSMDLLLKEIAGDISDLNLGTKIVRSQVENGERGRLWHPRRYIGQSGL